MRFAGLLVKRVTGLAHIPLATDVFGGERLGRCRFCALTIHTGVGEGFSCDGAGRDRCMKVLVYRSERECECFIAVSREPTECGTHIRNHKHTYHTDLLQPHPKRKTTAMQTEMVVSRQESKYETASIG